MNAPQSEEVVVETKVHETATHEFFVDRFSNVYSRSKDDSGRLKTQSVEALLLLDIAQTLADIRQWGVAQNLPYGQKVQTL